MANSNPALLTPRIPLGAAEPREMSIEPTAALVTGGTAGALTVLLCGLLFGAEWALAIAVGAAVVAFVRHARSSAIAFIVAAVCAALSLAPSTAALVLASIAFGIGLALAARSR